MTVGSRVLALVNVRGIVHAVEAACPHEGGPLDAGRVWDGKLECPWHHFLYDLATGENIYPRNVYPSDMPKLREQTRPLVVHRARVRGRRVLVRLVGGSVTD
jgi:nitrite reductase/ring-hydroxylating ferredoxin subunit